MTVRMKAGRSSGLRLVIRLPSRSLVVRFRNNSRVARRQILARLRDLCVDAAAVFAKGFAACLVPRRLTDRNSPPIFWSRLARSFGDEPARSNCVNEQGWCFCCTDSRAFPTSRRGSGGGYNPTRAAVRGGG